MNSTSNNAFPKLTSDNHKAALTFTGGQCTYAELDARINKFASGLLQGKTDLEEERIAFLMPGSLDYVTTLFGIWRAGGIAVPLNVSSAVPEYEHALSCVSATRLIANADYQPKIAELCDQLEIPITSVEDVLTTEVADLPAVTSDRRAMIIFTSGTTNKPKGVVTTHNNISSQITTLIDAWGWQEDDSIPLFLPLHHVHGIINVLCCGLWAGATVDVFPKFDAEQVLSKVADKTYSVFMAVPTVYVKIGQYLETLSKPEANAICNGFKEMRLNVSGSAACPVPLFNQWRDLTGQVLLERYGMTEIGMGLSNPYEGERRAGAVGVPLPGVECALFDEQNAVITEENTPGEIRIKGSNVFLEYWNNPEATEGTFHDGWFCTGDVAVIENGYYRIMGRSSVDIIKSGGYKLSALEIEGCLLDHQDIRECAVIGAPDDTWGEAVTAFVVLNTEASMTLDGLRAWCKDRMSAYKMPQRLELVEELPRNAMGKITKPALKKLL